jgi:hypothetical protein
MIVRHKGVAWQLSCAFLPLLQIHNTRSRAPGSNVEGTDITTSTASKPIPADDVNNSEGPQPAVMSSENHPVPWGHLCLREENVPYSVNHRIAHLADEPHTLRFTISTASTTLVKPLVSGEPHTFLFVKPLLNCRQTRWPRWRLFSRLVMLFLFAEYAAPRAMRVLLSCQDGFYQY